MIDIPCNSERFFPSKFNARKTDALQHVWSGVNGSQGSPRLPQQMNWENGLLVTGEPLKVQDFGKISGRFRGIYGIYLDMQ
jgi:hypothetical protein